MEASKVEVIKQAIKQVMEEEEGMPIKSSSDHIDHHLLLSKLMSQLEKLEAEAEAEDLAISKSDTHTVSDHENVLRLEEKERIVEELKKVKRQNFITHCLLSVMILLTVTWQISEVSIILMLKDQVTHPFRSIGSIFKWMIKSPKANGNEEQSDAPLIESSPINDVKIPHVELPKIGSSLI